MAASRKGKLQKCLSMSFTYTVRHIAIDNLGAFSSSMSVISKSAHFEMTVA